MSVSIAAEARRIGRPPGKAGKPDTTHRLFTGTGPITFDETAIAAGKTKQTIERWAREGMPHFKIGNSQFTTCEQFREYHMKLTARGGLAPPKKRSRR
jgi:hypothetical protein